MEKEVFDAIYKTVDNKTTEELLDIVNNHLHDCSNEQKWMIAVVLSKREVEFSLDDFPPHLCDKLYYIEKTKIFSPGYLILAVACVIIALIISIGSPGNIGLHILVISLGILSAYWLCNKVWKTNEVRTKIACTGIKSVNYTAFVEQSNNDIMGNKTTKDFIVDTLDQLNCQYQIHENRTEQFEMYYDIEFAFQAQYFVLRCFDSHIAVDLYYVGWYEEKMDSIDRVEKVKWAVNQTNTLTDVICSYHEYEEDNSIVVSSRYHFYLPPTMPDVKGFINVILTDMFKQRRVFEQLLIQAPVETVSEKETDCENIKVLGEC